MDRKTFDPTPKSPEQLAFSAEEATIGVQALAYYIETVFPSPGTDPDNHGLVAACQNIDGARRVITSAAQFVNFFQGLATKLNHAVTQPDAPVELSPLEIEGLGRALFHFGTAGVQHARNALNSEHLRSGSEWQHAELTKKIENTAKGAQDLYTSLGLIATSKDDVDWVAWPDI